MDRVVVAFSGGVDSTFLARAAREALGDRAVLATADSETYPASELEETRRLAELLGMRHEVVTTHELDNPEYARNAPNRCYFCKEELFNRLEPLAAAAGGAQLVYGANMDDLGDHRPGMEAARQKGVRAPMIEAELWKEEIRALSQALGLPTWDKPSFACLSSRFQYGDRITAEKLRQIDAAEAFVKSLGLPPVPGAPPRPARPPRAGAARRWTGSGRRGGARRSSPVPRARISLRDAWTSRDFRSGSANEALKWIGRK